MSTSKLSHTLTSDNLPALLAPTACAMCNGSGTIAHGDDPFKEVIAECEDCGGTGLVPYPGTFEQQTVDFISEVLAPIEELLAKSAQNIHLMHDPDSNTPYSFSLDPKWRTGYHTTIGEYCAKSFEAAAKVVFDKIRDEEANADKRKQLDRDVEAFKAARAAELGLPV